MCHLHAKNSKKKYSGAKPQTPSWGGAHLPLPRPHPRPLPCRATFKIIPAPLQVGQSLSSTVKLTSGVPQNSVLGPILFVVYISPVGDVISSYGVQYHQYADDTQLRLALRADNAEAGLSTLAACTMAVKNWY
jgi:hypothetical protein